MDGEFRGEVASGRVDFGKQSDDYAKYRPGFPPSFYNRLVHFLRQQALVAPDAFSTAESEVLQGLRVLDVGTGPGVVALELAKRGAEVVGIDIAEGQVLAAVAQAQRFGLSHRSSFAVATAEKTLQASESFDLITCGQCWPWFDHKHAIPELARVLKPGGILCIAHFCFLPKSSEIARKTEDLVLEFNQNYRKFAGADGLYPSQIDQVIEGGHFGFQEQLSYNHEQLFTAESWRGRMRTCNGVGSGDLSREKVAEFDNRLRDMLEVDRGGRTGAQDVFTVPHRVWAVMAWKPR